MREKTDAEISAMDFVEGEERRSEERRNTTDTGRDCMHTDTHTSHNGLNTCIAILSIATGRYDKAIPCPLSVYTSEEVGGRRGRRKQEEGRERRRKPRWGYRDAMHSFLSLEKKKVGRQ